MMLPMFYYKYFLKNFICTFKALTCIKGVPWSFQYTLYWFFRLLKPHINFRKHFCTYRWLEFLCLRLRWKHIRKGSSNGRYEQEAWLKHKNRFSVHVGTILLFEDRAGKKTICLSGAVTGNTFLIELCNWLYIFGTTFYEDHIYNGFYGHSKCVTIRSSCFWLHSQTRIMLPDASWWHINELGPSLAPEPYSSSSSQKASCKDFPMAQQCFFVNKN